MNLNIIDLESIPICALQGIAEKFGRVVATVSHGGKKTELWIVEVTDDELRGLRCVPGTQGDEPADVTISFNDIDEIIIN
jgi:hypothetical protein